MVGNVNDDTTATSFGDSVGTVIIETGYYYNEKFDVSCFIRDAHIDDIRSGWNNPKKIAIPKNNKPNNIRMQTRNQLPYKFRRIDSNI